MHQGAKSGHAGPSRGTARKHKLSQAETRTQRQRHKFHAEDDAVFAVNLSLPMPLEADAGNNTLARQPSARLDRCR